MPFLTDIIVFPQLWVFLIYTGQCEAQNAPLPYDFLWYLQQGPGYNRCHGCLAPMEFWILMKWHPRIFGRFLWNFWEISMKFLGDFYEIFAWYPWNLKITCNGTRGIKFLTRPLCKQKAIEQQAKKFRHQRFCLGTQFQSSTSGALCLVI